MVDNLRVNLRGGNVLMAEQLARGINVNIQSQHHGRESVSADMVGHVLVYASRLRPFVKDDADTDFRRKVENLVLVLCIATLRQPLHRLFG